MKRFLAFVLMLCFLPLTGAFCLEEELPPALYVGKMRLAGKVFEDWAGVDGITHINTIPENAWVRIHALYPTFALVSYDDGRIYGYVKRICIDQIRTLDSFTTPPYGVEFNHFMAVVAAKDAPVTTLPGGGETLITLHEGAKISFIGFENGYAKIIYHRQYAYIDSRLLGDLINVYESPEDAKSDAPIASYTSFYKITTDQSNLNRMVNIDVACRKLRALTFPPESALDFNKQIGPYSAKEGYLPATVLVDGGSKQGYGGGTCQVSSTLYNVVLQLPGLYVIQRRAHGGNGASYLPIGVDAAVGNSTLNFRFRNKYPFPIRIDASAQDGALTLAIYKITE